MELKNIIVTAATHHIVKAFDNINEALVFAVSESRKACFAGRDLEASHRVTLAVGTKGFGFSMLNFAHYSNESLDEQAAWFEVAITKDGRIIRNDEGEIDTALFQIRYNVLKSFFKALENAPKATLKSVWVSLAMLDQGGCWTKEEAMARYAEFYHNFA